MTRSDYIGKVGSRIRTLRQRKGLSLQGLAEMSDISQKNLGEIERGRANPTLHMLEKIASNLEVDVPDLTDVEHERDRKELVSEMNSLMEKASDREMEQLFRVAKAIMSSRKRLFSSCSKRLQNI